MEPLHIAKTTSTPEIIFSPDENFFMIRGSSSPEDVRAMYYPVIAWVRTFVDEIISGKNKKYASGNALIFQTDLSYFNSSSAKFFFDIFLELKRLTDNQIRVMVEWFYDEEDLDQKDAGADISLLVEMDFAFIPKKR
jgi:hypothetical protein